MTILKPANSDNSHRSLRNGQANYFVSALAIRTKDMNVGALKIK